jgi:hypothetical protein
MAGDIPSLQGESNLNIYTLATGIFQARKEAQQLVAMLAAVRPPELVYLILPAAGIEREPDNVRH